LFDAGENVIETAVNLTHLREDLRTGVAASILVMDTNFTRLDLRPAPKPQLR
jgi:hypothetical protein